MPVPKPRSGESKNKFISRCISFLHNEGTTGDQAVAICHSQWGRKEDEMSEEKSVPRVLGQGTIAGQYEDFDSLPEGVEVPKRRGWDTENDLDEDFPVK